MSTSRKQAKSSLVNVKEELVKLQTLKMLDENTKYFAQVEAAFDFAKDFKDTETHIGMLQLGFALNQLELIPMSTGITPRYIWMKYPMDGEMHYIVPTDAFSKTGD